MDHVGVVFHRDGRSMDAGPTGCMTWGIDRKGVVIVLFIVTLTFDHW